MKPMLQLGDAATTVTMNGVMVENCSIPGQLILMFDGPCSVEISVKIDISESWLCLVIAFLLKFVTSQSVVIEPETILSKQSDNTFECLP